MNRAIHQPLSVTPVAPSHMAHRSENIFSAADFFATLRRHLLAFLLLIAVCTAIGAAWVAVTPSVYIATALILLEPHRAHTPATDAGVSDQPALDTATADSQIQVLKSERLLRFVFESLDLAHSEEFSSHKADYSAWLTRLPPPLSNWAYEWWRGAPSPLPETTELPFLKFMNSVTVRRLGQSYVLELSYSAPSGEIAAQRANSIAMAYIRDQIEEKASAASQGEELLQSRIVDIKRESQEAMDAVKLGSIPSARFPDADARVISSAIVPLRRAFPQLGLTLAFSATFGLFSGLCLIFLRLGSDKAVRTRQQVVAVTGLECLACLPYDRKRARKTGIFNSGTIENAQDPTLRALMSARAMVLSSLPTSSGIVIGVFSVRPDEGKTTIALGLAQIVAGSQSRAVLIDGNFLNPTLTRSSSQGALISLNGALRGAGSADKQLEIGDGVTLVPAFLKAETPYHGQFVGGPVMREFLEGLRQKNVVIIESPATSLSSDALALAPLLDGVILVVEAGKTTEPELRDAVAALSVRTRVLGVILNKITK